MTRLHSLLAAGLMVGGVAVFAARSARADWPMSRHDPQRTAVAVGKSNITNPQPTWRFPLGGALIYTQQLIADADGDGTPEFYFVRGSSAVGKRIDDTQMWHSPSMGVNALLGLADLDGDKVPDLVLTVGTNRVAVLNGLTGNVDWTNPTTEIGFRGTVLIGDLTGDGLPEVLIQDCGCCAEKGAIPGAVYSFAGGTKAPKLIWQIPYASCGGGYSTTLLDMNGDGSTDVLFGRENGFDLVAGATGAVIASIDYGDYLQVSRCVPARITGAGEQAVCVFANGTNNDSGHRVFAIGKGPGAGTSLEILWDQKLGIADGQINLQPGMVADLDGDGSKEVVVTAATGQSTWSTFVLDAAGGAVLATINGHKLVGTAPVLSNGRSLILTEEGDGTGGWQFKRVPAPAVTQLWQLPGQGLVSFRDFPLSMRASPTMGLVAIDLTGDGTPDLVTGDADGFLRVLDTSQAAGPPVVAGLANPPPIGSRIWASPVRIGGKPALVTAWSDGIFRMHALENGAFKQIAAPGVHFDGAYNTGFWRTLEGIPVVGALAPGEPDSVLVTDSNGILHVLDVSKADATTPPVERWTLPNVSSPIVLPNLAFGAPGVALVQRTPNTLPTQQQVVALDAKGNQLWVSKLAGHTSSDLLATDLNGDGVPDVLASWAADADTTGTVHTRALSGTNGATIWDGDTYPDTLLTGPSLGDFDGDGVLDLYSQSTGLHVFSGATGKKISPPPAESAANGMPLLVDVDGDGKSEVVIQGGYARVTVLSSDLSTVLYKSNEVQSTIQYGALARCPAGPRLVESTYFYHTSRLTLTDLAPGVVGTETTMYLAGGQKFPDEASATAAGVFQGVLTAVSMHENITGLGHPSAVVGSNDGWLYAVDPCTGNLDFAYDFKDAVGVITFGDTDGDGLDEIIVEVSDGFIYGVKQFVPGTGGTGGMGTGGSTATGGSGGMAGAPVGGGGAGTGGAPSHRPEEFLIYGRVTCICGLPGDAEGAPLAPLLATGLALGAAVRRQGRRRS